MRTIGERIREIRGKASRGVFAALHGIHPNTLRRYEMNERTPDPAFLLSIGHVGDRVEPGAMSGEMSGEISGEIQGMPGDKASNPLERENVLLREMVALQKECGDLRMQVAKLEARNAELERQLVEALKPEAPAAVATGMSRAG